METKRIMLIAFLTVCSVIAIAQENKAFWNEKMLKIAYENECKDWVDIREGYFFTKDNFFEKNKDAFSFSSDDGMRYISSTAKDELGYIRHLFQQTYKGIDIEGAQYKLHEKDGRIFCANGHSIQKINEAGFCNTKPELLEKTALQYALQHINAETYAWEIVQDRLLDKDKELPAYNYPQGTLLLTKVSNNLSSESKIKPEPFILAYKFEISAINPSSSTIIYVCANTGKILKQYSMVYENEHTGNALTLYYGWREIITYKHLGKYRLLDEGRGGGIHTYKVLGNNYFDYRNWEEYKDADNQWSLESERPATTVHWGMGKTYDYFYQVHGLNSYDNNGKLIECVIVDGVDNAYWYPNQKFFAFGNSSNVSNKNPYAALDVVAHEFTHAVITYSQNPLNSNDEPGALNESFADIFGAMVEFYVFGEQGNYYHGDNIVIGGAGMSRDMTNPNNTSHPHTYNRNYWYKGNTQTDFVHTNSGVQNYWFYLLAEGGNGVNDNNYHYSIQGIGVNSFFEVL
jgi:Zn-dependent metalloprotease